MHVYVFWLLLLFLLCTNPIPSLSLEFCEHINNCYQLFNHKFVDVLLSLPSIGISTNPTPNPLSNNAVYVFFSFNLIMHCVVFLCCFQCVWVSVKCHVHYTTINFIKLTTNSKKQLMENVKFIKKTKTKSRSK